MAEIFGAVASGAGLISLAMQLLESAEKLHGFYHTSEYAPETLRELAEEMETISLSLRHLEQHRQHDDTLDDLLDRCIGSCQR